MEPLKIKGSVCGKQDLKLLLYDSRLSSIFHDRFISTLSRFWTFLVFPIPSQTVGISERFWNTDQSNCISDIPGFLSKDELENRQPMADCRKELLMEIGVSEQPKRHKPLFYKGSKQYGTIWENLEKRQLHSQLHSNCIHLWPLCA